MKFICLGYADHSLFAAMSEAEMAAAIETCMAYDDVLRRGGHFAGGEALQPANHAVTMRHRDGKTIATDGPFTETKEQLGGILILEASDMSQAVELMSRHPGVKFGPFEIRPADESVNAMIEARQQASKRLMQRNPINNDMHTVRLHRVLMAPAERVYKAFLDADALCRWLPPHGFVAKVHESRVPLVVDALIKADKDFDLLVLPGVGHSSGGAYGTRKRFDFFVRHLHGVEPPHWNGGVALVEDDVDGEPEF
jgi:hypothetical protein